MKYLLILSVLLLSGCNGMANKEIAEEIKFCREANLIPHLHIDHWTGGVVGVLCLPDYEILFVQTGEE